MCEVKISFRCEGCGATLSFPSSEAGTVQDCPECGGWVDVPEVVRQDRLKDGPPWRSRQEELNARYFEESVRQQAEIGRQIEVTRDHQRRTGEHLERAAADRARQAELLDGAARVLQRFEAIADRFEALLSRWEEKA
jgi:hypothetical protein